jgi:hypothetical protein
VTTIDRSDAEGIIEPNDLIWVHDCHLMPIADPLRRRGHANRIGFFQHVPMPPPEVLRSLPNHETFIPLLLQYEVAAILRRQDFTALPGISIIVACLPINQLAYAIAIR